MSIFSLSRNRLDRSPVLSYMLPEKEQTRVTENYVATPPALLVVDERGTVFTLGMKLQKGPRGEYAWDVLCNGIDTGEIASRIERRYGKTRAFTLNGWKIWNGRSFL